MSELIKPLFFSHTQLKALTGYARRAQQRKQLADLGIPFKLRRDGTPIVLTEVVEQQLGLNTTGRPKCREPDVRALRGLQGEQTP